MSSPEKKDGWLGVVNGQPRHAPKPSPEAESDECLEDLADEIST